MARNKVELTRRTFLKKSSASASLLTAFPYSLLANVFNVSDDNRILVIGAGLAGLSCAYELDRAGYNVMVLEAKSHSGGRVRTYRDSFADNLYAEMGAEYVDSSDEYVQKYCKHFELNILPAKQYDGIYVRNKHINMDDLRSGKVKLPFDGAIRGKLFGQEVKYIQKWIDLVKKEGIDSKKVQSLDKVSVQQLLKKENVPLLHYY